MNENTNVEETFVEEVDETTEEETLNDDLFNEEFNEESDQEEESIEEDNEDNAEENETDEETEDPDNAEEEQSEPIKKQTAEQNRLNAERRRQAEAKVKEKEQELAKILKPYKVSSYEELDNLVEVKIDDKTLQELKRAASEKMEDEDDYIERYKDRQFTKLLRAKEAARIAHKEVENKLRLKAQQDMTEFKSKYGIDINEALKDPQFADYAEGKIGSVPIIEVYERFKKWKTPSADKSTRATSTGSSGATSALTQAEKMSLKFFNEQNPAMKMTEKEYLNYKRR